MAVTNMISVVCSHTDTLAYTLTLTHTYTYSFTHVFRHGQNFPTAKTHIMNTLTHCPPKHTHTHTHTHARTHAHKEYAKFL